MNSEMAQVGLFILTVVGAACVGAGIGWLCRLGREVLDATTAAQPRQPATLPRRVPGAALLPTSPQFSILDLPTKVDWLGAYPGRPGPGRVDPAPRRARHGAMSGYWDTPTELHQLVGPLVVSDWPDD